jgi:phosphohistidine phosphatase
VRSAAERRRCGYAIVHPVALLYLLRHAKSSWDDVDLDDRDRPLAPRGQRAARRIAAHIRREHIAPAMILCSSARRARETLELIESALPADAEKLVEDKLYYADAEDLLGRLHQVPAAVPALMLIGHNPSLQELALALSARGELRDRLHDDFPTGALATLDIGRSSWERLRPGHADLVGYAVPRDLK